ncbi:MAG: acyltransferase [Candidatus Zipacnadales bacterium]
MSAVPSDTPGWLYGDLSRALESCERDLSRMQAHTFGRSAQIDFLRAIAIVAVVLLHVWGPGMEVTPTHGPLQAAFFAVFVLGSTFAVPLFFLISGYVLTRRANPQTWSWRRWWQRRAWRILPPYLFWSLTSCLVFGELDLRTGVVRLATGSASYQMYFVVALLQAYVLWSLAMPWLWHQPLPTQSRLLFPVIAITPLMHILRTLQLSATEEDALPFLRATVFPWIGYFALGVWLALRSADESERPQYTVTSLARRRGLLWLSTLALGSLSLMVQLRVTYTGPHVEHPAITLLKPLYAVSMSGLLALIGEVWQARASPRARRFVAALAKDTYGIYLCHVLVIWALSPVLYLIVPGLGLGTEIAYRAFTLVVILGISWGIVRVLSLLPGVRLFAGTL